MENTMTLALHILFSSSILQKGSHWIKSKIFKLNQYLVRALRCLRVVRWPSLNLPLHVVMHRHIHLEETSLKNFSDSPLSWSGKKGSATQTLVPKVPLEVQKNRHFFVNHVYYHVVILGHRSHHRPAVTW